MLVPNLGFVLLFVENPIKSSAFYSQILNLKPLEESPTFVLFALSNGTMLGLWSHLTAEPPVIVKAGASEIAFSHDEIDELHQKWVEMDVPMAQAPTDMDFGRTFVALDPDGHRIRIYRLQAES